MSLINIPINPRWKQIFTRKRFVLSFQYTVTRIIALFYDITRFQWHPALPIPFVQSQGSSSYKETRQKLTVDDDDDAQQAEQQVSQAHLLPSSRDYRKKGGHAKKGILTCFCRTSFFNLVDGKSLVSLFLELSLAISRPGTGGRSSRSWHLLSSCTRTPWEF